MKFKVIKEVKILYPINIKFKPMAIGLGVGLALAFSGCASNQSCVGNSCKANIKAPKQERNSTIAEPENLGGIPPIPPISISEQNATIEEPDNEAGGEPVSIQVVDK